MPNKFIFDAWESRSSSKRVAACTISPVWIAKRDIATLFDLAGTQPDDLAEELGIRISKDSYSPMID